MSCVITSPILSPAAIDAIRAHAAPRGEASFLNKYREFRVLEVVPDGLVLENERTTFVRRVAWSSPTPSEEEIVRVVEAVTTCPQLPRLHVNCPLESEESVAAYFRDKEVTPYSLRPLTKSTGERVLCFALGYLDYCNLSTAGKYVIEVTGRVSELRKLGEAVKARNATTTFGTGHSVDCLDGMADSAVRTVLFRYIFMDSETRPQAYREIQYVLQLVVGGLVKGVRVSRPGVYEEADDEDIREIIKMIGSAQGAENITEDIVGKYFALHSWSNQAVNYKAAGAAEATGAAAGVAATL